MTISGSLTPFGGLVPVNIDDLFSLILDPAAYNASGSTMSTTGTINLSGTTPVMTLAGGLDFEVGQGVYISMNTSTPPFLTSIATVISPETLVLAGTAPTTYVGANSTIFHDDAAALNAAIRSGYVTISGESGAFYQINGGGRPYNVSGPLTQQSGLVLEDFKLIPLASSFWVSGTLLSGTFGSGPTSNGVIYNESASDVLCRDIYIDLDTLAVNGLVNYASSGVKYENCRVIHWAVTPTQTISGIGLYNAGKCNASNCSFVQWNSKDREAPYPATFNSGYALYCDSVVNKDSGDSLFHGCNFNGGLPPVYVAEDVNYVRFSDCHTWPCWGSVAPEYTLTNPENFEIHSSDVTIEDHYLDSGYILIEQHTTVGPDIKIDIGCCIYQEALTPYGSHVLVTTSIPGSKAGNIFISPDSVFAGTLGGSLSGSLVPIIHFETSGSGSWEFFSTTIQSEALAAQNQNLLMTNGGLLVAELSTARSVVATLMGNSTTATSLSFIDSATSLSPPPQVGSEGNDIVLSYNGTVAFRGSALNGCAIIGNSPSTLAVTTNAVYSDNTSTWLGLINSGTTVSPPPQVGSQGNDIVLRYHGTSVFRGSYTGGCAIIGQSTGTEGYTAHTVTINADGNPALQAIHGGSTNPQGYTINFTNAAPNNKTDAAFGFMDTLSSTQFKTAIWSDGSVAHPEFGFNVSEFQSMEVAAQTYPGTIYQIAKGTGNRSILAGTYELQWTSTSEGEEYRQQYMIVAVGYCPSDGYALITVLHNWCRAETYSIGIPTVAYDSDFVPYLLANLSPTVAGTLSVQARGYDTNIALLETPSGTTSVTSGVLVNTVNQTGGGTLLSYNSLTSASSNVVTDKIEIEIGGTIYYLLASTLSS